MKLNLHAAGIGWDEIDLEWPKLRELKLGGRKGGKCVLNMDYLQYRSQE